MTTTPNPCTCTIVFMEQGNENDEIEFCPLHAAAEQMRDALANINFDAFDFHGPMCGDRSKPFETYQEGIDGTEHCICWMGAVRAALDAAEGRTGTPATRTGGTP